jgi:hypothetical protein
VEVLSMVARYVRHVSESDQKEEASSSAKQMPPVGAPKAAATPAAAPPLTKSRLALSLRKRYGHFLPWPGMPLCVQPGMVAKFAPSTEPTWMSGPSLPMMRPEVTEKHTPTIFTMAVLKRRKRR